MKSNERPRARRSSDPPTSDIERLALNGKPMQSLPPEFDVAIFHDWIHHRVASGPATGVVVASTSCDGVRRREMRLKGWPRLMLGK